jgi:hypothetical protein
MGADLRGTIKLAQTEISHAESAIRSDSQSYYGDLA